MDIHELLQITAHRRASDLHLAAGRPPTIRADGELTPVGTEPLTPDEIEEMVYSMLTAQQIQKFEETHELDFSYGIGELSRFRVNVHREKGSVGASMRLIPARPPTMEELELPEVACQFARLPRGLILVTGPTGSGKSSTLAAMIDLINTERNCHIITFEDPIEFLHSHKKSIVKQREVGLDTQSFAAGLKYVLRQDPDVVLVGEMRDLETIAAVITVAETGHLVLSTLHTQDAPQSVDRIIDVFPPYQQQQIKTQLSVTLQGVISQQLLRRADGSGRVAAREIMVVTPAIANLIREGKAYQIYTLLQTGAELGMMSMDQSLADLARRGIITTEDAMAKARNLEELQRLLYREERPVPGRPLIR